MRAWRSASPAEGKTMASGKKSTGDADDASRRPVTFGQLPGKTRRLLSLYPVRQPLKWRLEDGRIVISYRKQYTPLEEWLQKRLKGPTHVRRPLDECGTLIWTMCDGRHTILDICDAVDDRYHEKVEPVFRTVIAFVERLNRTGLVRMEKEKMKGRPQRVVKEGGREERENYLVLNQADGE